MPSKEIVKNQTIGEVFIKEFVRQLILNSRPKSVLNVETIERINKRISEEIPEAKIVRRNPVDDIRSNIQNIRRRYLPIVKTNRPPMASPFRRRITTPNNQSIKPQLRTNAKPISIQEVPQSLVKIQQVLRDPSVMSVECAGPGKNLMVNRAGLMSRTPITLSKAEIDNIVNEFSQKTKIPLITGVFKALYNNLLITAVTSDMTDSRFVIEKQVGTPNLPTQDKNK